MNDIWDSPSTGIAPLEYAIKTFLCWNTRKRVMCTSFLMQIMAQRSHRTYTYALSSTCAKSVLRMYPRSSSCQPRALLKQRCVQCMSMQTSSLHQESTRGATTTHRHGTYLWRQSGRQHNCSTRPSITRTTTLAHPCGFYPRSGTQTNR